MVLEAPWECKLCSSAQCASSSVSGANKRRLRHSAPPSPSVNANNSLNEFPTKRKEVKTQQKRRILKAKRTKLKGKERALRKEEVEEEEEEEVVPQSKAYSRVSGRNSFLIIAA